MSGNMETAIKKQIWMGVLVSVVLMTFPVFASAAILFEDNFDGHDDWSPVQGVNGVTCKLGDVCATPIPTGYFDYRVAGEEGCSNIDGSHNTININSLYPRGGAGKSFMYWNEPCYSRGGSWGSDGLLGVSVSGQEEIYVKYWIRFQSDWRWNGDGSAGGRALGTAVPSPMQKFLHVSHYDADNPGALWDYFSGTQNKPRFVGGMAKYGGGSYRTQLYQSLSALTATRDNSNSVTTNDYFGPPPLDWADVMAPGDGQWHSFEWYLKLNSAGGVADGESKFWYDGNLVHSKVDTVWVPSGDDPNGYKWNHIWLGGNNANLYLPANEQWYVVDDLVISNTRVAQGYVIGGADISAPDAPTGLSIQ